jgi:hypothetical protein
LGEVPAERTIAVVKIAQQVAMHTLDFMMLALLDTAGRRTDSRKYGLE